MRRNILNSPVVIIGLATTLSSISMPSMEGVFNTQKDYSMYSDTSSNDFFNSGEKFVERVTLEEDTKINPINLSELTQSSILDDEDEEYTVKDDLKSYISSMEEMFGGMRYLTKEGQKDYDDNLDNLYKDSGVQLFDFL
ncbi:hypothetical protein [Inconstantimicrobium porci]|uniref:hypothetical protein n=1 Tax=Inconstantimicrobium porci TaxID=2652291 RepID=UPI0024098179|nr:hypothetical protein [Inconstantimicrobium porci]MDD6770887.1 hypothetical protein [Inconstantimicrobium porci]